MDYFVHNKQPTYTLASLMEFWQPLACPELVLCVKSGSLLQPAGRLNLLKVLTPASRLLAKVSFAYAFSYAVDRFVAVVGDADLLGLTPDVSTGLASFARARYL